MKNIINKHMMASCLFCILVLYTGCKKSDWYDMKTDKSLAVPATLKDMQALLDNVSVLNDYAVALGEIGSDGHIIKDEFIQGLIDSEFNAYTWSYEKPYRAVADWAAGNAIGAYPKIYYCNLVLEGIQRISNTNDDINNVKGQALFQRARNFYELAQVFAPPYMPSTANTDLSIPLRLESDINVPSKRSTVKQTYEQVINDLLVAKTLLPITPLYKTRASKPAVFALLARIYLSMEDYANAGAYADSCLSVYSKLLNYNTLNASITLPFPYFNPEVIFHTRMLFYSSLRTAMFIEPALYELYVDNDLRKVIFFDKNSLTGDIKSKGTYTGGSPLFTGLATDEVYLIRAECSARKGDKNAAMQDLNLLLRNRWKAGYFNDYTAIDAEDALKKILTERKKELLLRGLRWSDLRRLNRDERFKTTLTRILLGKTYTLEPASYQYTLPIPDDVIQITGMAQNPGWKK